MSKDKIIEQAVSDAIIERPISFELEGVKYEIHPPTLGKMQILSKLYLQLDIDEKEFTDKPHRESMRICESKTDEVCHIMAIATLQTKEELLNEDTVKKRADLFKWSCKPQDFATCIMAILTLIDYENFITSIRLTKMLRQNEPTVKRRAVRVE